MGNLKRFWIVVLLIAALLAMHPPWSLGGARLAAYEENLLLLINQYRIEKGLNSLAIDEKLTRFAERHSTQMENTNVLSHEGFHERFRLSGRSLCVENVGWNYQTPEGQFSAWKASGEHNKNLLNNRITHTGIAQIGAYVTFFACTGEE